jgi:hypothetical protein
MNMWLVWALLCGNVILIVGMYYGASRHYDQMMYENEQLKVRIKGLMRDLQDSKDERAAVRAVADYHKSNAEYLKGELRSIRDGVLPVLDNEVTSGPRYS